MASLGRPLPPRQALERHGTPPEVKNRNELCRPGELTQSSGTDSTPRLWDQAAAFQKRRKSGQPGESHSSAPKFSIFCSGGGTAAPQSRYAPSFFFFSQRLVGAADLWGKKGCFVAGHSGPSPEPADESAHFLAVTCLNFPALHIFAPAREFPPTTDKQEEKKKGQKKKKGRCSFVGEGARMGRPAEILHQPPCSIAADPNNNSHLVRPYDAVHIPWHIPEWTQPQFKTSTGTPPSPAAQGQFGSGTVMFCDPPPSLDITQGTGIGCRKPSEVLIFSAGFSERLVSNTGSPGGCPRMSPVTSRALGQ